MSSPRILGNMLSWALTMGTTAATVAKAAVEKRILSPRNKVKY